MTGRRAFLKWAGASIAVGGAAFVAFDHFTNRSPFDAKVWRDCERENQWRRKAMVGDLLKTHSPVGMTREQIHALLGVPAWNDNDFYAYSLGATSVVAMDFWWLAVDFKKDKAVRAYVFRD